MVPCLTTASVGAGHPATSASAGFSPTRCSSRSSSWLVVSIPVSLGLALYISEIAPKALQRTLVSIVDLMSAVPSVVYAFWGLEFLQGHVIGISRWLSTWFGWVPIFKVTGADPSSPLASSSVFSASTFVVGLAVSLMVIPIQCSVM